MFQKPSIITVILAITIFGFLAVAETVSAAPDTLTLQVGGSSDDVRVREGWWGWNISTVANSGLIGDEGFFGDQAGGIGMRFTNVTIPLGSIIDSAILQVRAHQNNNQVIIRSKIRAEDTGNAGTFTDLADYQARPTTTEEIMWDGIGLWIAGTWYDSPDIKDVIQTVVNRSDWASGSAMVIFFDDHDKRSDNGARRNVSLYDSNPGFAPRLVIEYTPYERCKKPPGWNSAEEDCCIEVTYQDPMPGSGLENCGYRIGSKIGEPDIYDMPALFDSVVCFGMASTTAVVIMEIGPLPKACHAVGEAACKIETIAHDIAGNYTTASSTYNISAYDLSVSSDPMGIDIVGAPPIYGSTTNYEILDIPSGTYIELTAPPTHVVGGTTYHFDNWTGCDSPPSNITCELTMNGDKTVVANFSAGPPPPTPLPVTWNHCDTEGLSIPTFHWNYNPIGVEPQAAYHIIIHGAPLDFDLEVDPDGSSSYTAPAGYVRNNLGWGGTYSWEIRTKDGGHWSNWASDSFTMPANAFPWFDLTSSDNFDWMPETIRIAELIQFYSTSTCYNINPAGAVCNDPPAIFEWTFEHGSSSPAFVKDPIITFDQIVLGGNEITLEVCDGSGLLFEGLPYCCLKDTKIDVFYPLPEYREVAPIGRLDNFLARLSNIFARF